MDLNRLGSLMSCVIDLRLSTVVSLLEQEVLRTDRSVDDYDKRKLYMIFSTKKTNTNWN